MLKAGIYNNLDINEYHAEEGISSTGVSLILECPARYHYEFLVKPKDLTIEDMKKKNDDYKVGRAVHMMVLEPQRFENNFYCMTEKVNLATKEGKSLYNEALEKAQGRDVLRKGEWEDSLEMSECIKKHSIWTKFHAPLVEQSILWNGGIYNTRLKARPDVFNDKLIIDIKTTSNLAAFPRSLFTYGYHRQAAMQIDSLKNLDGKTRHFAFFVVEKKAPFLTACFTLDEHSIELGRQQYLDAAATYSDCMKNNQWPGYPEDVQLITLPNWLNKEEPVNV